VWSGDRYIDEQLLVDALAQAIPSITRLRRLEIICGRVYHRGGWANHARKPTIALDVFAAVMGALWMQVAPTIQELRVDVHIDTLPVLAAFDASFAPNLLGVDLRIYGRVIPEAIGSADMEAALAAIAHTLVLPAAGRLNELDFHFVPCNVGPRLIFKGEFAHLSIREPAFPQPLLDGFFGTIRASRFPRLRHLGVAAPLLGSECPFVVDLVTACLRRGALKSLALMPAFPQENSQSYFVIPYMQMIREHCAHWEGLQSVSLFYVDGAYVEAPGHPPIEVDTVVPFIHPLFSMSSLQELSLSGHFMTVAALRKTLQALHHGGSGATLRRLAVKVFTVRPSTFDTLFELAPSIESLRMEMREARPDGEITEDLLRTTQAKKDSLANMPRELPEPYVSYGICLTWPYADNIDLCRGCFIGGERTYTASPVRAYSRPRCPFVSSRHGRCVTLRSSTNRRRQAAGLAEWAFRAMRRSRPMRFNTACPVWC
jgi:hypothetical protein